MVIGVTVLVIGIAIVAIWILIELKRFKHKMLAIFLIVIILFSYLSFALTIRGKDINLKSVDGIKEAGTLYMAWLGGVFKNLKTITANAIDMDWSAKNVDTTPKKKDS